MDERGGQANKGRQKPKMERVINRVTEKDGAGRMMMSGSGSGRKEAYGGGRLIT